MQEYAAARQFITSDVTSPVNVMSLSESKIKGDRIPDSSFTPVSSRRAQEYAAARQFINRGGSITGPVNVMRSPDSEIKGRLPGTLERRAADDYWQRPNLEEL